MRKCSKNAAKPMYKIMLDTNIVVDYLMGRAPACDECRKLIIAHAEGRHAVYASALSLKDAYYLISMHLKRMERLQSGELSESMANAANEIAWSCVRQLVDCLIIAPAGRSESLRAFTFKPVHGDFEDDLIIASALSAKVDYFVSNDKRLLRHAPIACLSSADMLALVDAADAASR